MRPVIGITGGCGEEAGTVFLKEYYLQRVLSAGGIPLILPPLADHTAIKRYTSICQGVILSGGGDIDPAYWNEIPGIGLGKVEPARDFFEVLLARQMLAVKKPLLGICRGCQVLNVAAGGSLYQDIFTGMCHQQNAPRDFPFHDIFIQKGSRLEQVLQSTAVKVNSFHHQAVKEPGRGLRVSALAPDGTIEAVESISGVLILGVQWHPECLQDKYALRLFTAFVNEAARS